MWVVEGEGVGGGGRGKGEAALRGEGGPRGVGVHKGLLRCEGKAHGADAIYLEGPAVEAHQRKEKAFPPPRASSFPPFSSYSSSSHRSEAPQDHLSLGGRHTRPSLPVLIFVRPNNNNKFVLSLRVYVRPQYQYPSIMYRIYLQRQNRQLFPAASVTPPPPAAPPLPAHPPHVVFAFLLQDNGDDTTKTAALTCTTRRPILHTHASSAGHLARPFLASFSLLPPPRSLFLPNR